jgi:ABC-type dipeptide/oligopeptide/nickel transport system permease component
MFEWIKKIFSKEEPLIPSKKGMIGGPIGTGLSTALGLGVLTIVIAVCAIILSTMRNITSDTAAGQVINNSTYGISVFASLQPVFWIVLGLVVIIGMLLGVFAVYGNRND